MSELFFFICNLLTDLKCFVQHGMISQQGITVFFLQNDYIDSEQISCVHPI